MDYGFYSLGHPDETALNILKKRYFWPGETYWDDVVNRVMTHVMGDEPAEVYYPAYQMLLNRYFIPNSPVLFNAGRPDAGLSACFVVDMPDDINGIMKTFNDFVMICRKGGGAGVTLSKLRPEGSPVAGSTHGYAGGPVKFYNALCQLMDVMAQSGKRPMAQMGTMSVFHPDILKFINAKSKEGVMATTNISVVVNADFMNAVLADETYWTEFKGVRYEELRARDVFGAIVEGAWRNGEPGLLFDEKLNSGPYAVTGQEILASNPCFTGEMRLLTADGYKTFSKLNGTTFQVITPTGETSSSTVWFSGNKPVVKIKLSNRKVIEATPDHVFALADGSSCQAADLTGKKLQPYLNRPILDERFTLCGFAQGDGQLTRLKSGTHKGVEVNIGAKDQDILFLLDPQEYTVAKDGRRIYVNSGFRDELVRLGFSEKVLPERTFPATYSTWELGEKAAFLRGCFSANGCVIKGSRVAYKTTCKQFANELMNTLLVDFGIKSRITTNKANKVTFPDGTYLCRESYDVNIGQYESLLRFYNKINFVQEYKVEDLSSLIDGRAFRVTSVTPIGNRDVYDFTEPTTHWGVVEGVVVHNCGEMPLPPNGACNLGSLDISKFLQDGKLDYDLLRRAVQLAVVFLDNVASVSSYPTPEITAWVRDNNPVGLGIMGFADYLLKIGVAYGSKASLKELDSIMGFIYGVAHEKSQELGKIRGYPKACRKLSSMRRNITLLTIAPTGTISLIAGCSSGIEPVFSEITLRSDNTGTYQITHPYADERHFRCAVSANGAKEVTWQEHLAVQNAAQEHVDSGVSKTINLPNNASRGAIWNAFVAAWKSPYIKGVTVYRNQSRKAEVLTPKNLKEDLDLCPVCGEALVREGGCTHCSSCDYSLCSI